MTPPLRQHSDIACGLFVILYQEIKRLNLDWIVRQGDVGVRTGRCRSRIPDITVLERSVWESFPSQSAFILEEVPPLLVIEVVSDSSAKDDYRHKRTEYAAIAIPEYWIVDPISQKVSILTWVEGLYEQQIFLAHSPIRTPTLPELSLSAAQILQL
jgi:Uma2 family endonuclease